jgi:ParB family chromosome partitioning protein
MEFHQVANIFPLLQGEEFKDFCQDIKANGLLEPIWLHPDGGIIDGRNRYRACNKMGVALKFRTWNGKGSLIDFILSLNLHRRHLTSGQRAVLALEVEPFYAEENAKIYAKTVGRPKKDSNEKSVEKIPPIKEKSRDQAARAVGTNGRYVSDAKRLKRDAPKVFEQVKLGEISIVDAKKKAFETNTPNIKQPMQVLVSHKELDYYTPSKYIETARTVLGAIDLDPASSAIANERVNAEMFFTQDDNGLDRDWWGNVWLNPPYSKSEGKSNQETWAKKLIDEYQSGRVKAAILLSKAAFGYNWFEKLFRDWPVCLSTERIAFIKPDGTTDGMAKHSTAFFYFGCKLDEFIEIFKEWGCIIDQGNGIVVRQEREDNG